MFEISVQHTFAAAHALRNYHGKCENLHGHNYRVEVKVQGGTLNAAGMLFDFVELKRDLRDITEELDHRFLNELGPFLELSPSAENIAKYLYDQLQARMLGRAGVADAKISEVKVWETEIQYAAYRP